jgi:hypothetical protein
MALDRGCVVVPGPLMQLFVNHLRATAGQWLLASTPT